jgi:hypothetical protein
VTVEERIQALVVKWLEVERHIKATSAKIDEDDWEIQHGSRGCDTCDYGSTPNYLELTIWYSLEGEYGHQHYIEVAKDPLSFLAELLKLEDETK